MIGPLTETDFNNKALWLEFFGVVFRFEDEKKQAEQDVQRVSTMINALQKPRQRTKKIEI